MFIRTIRRFGYDDVGIWGLGANTRWLFLFLARVWEKIPLNLRRRLPFQILQLHSVRLHNWRLSEQGFAGLSGIMARSARFVVDGGQTLVFTHDSTNPGFTGFFAKPQGKPLGTNAEVLGESRIVVSGGHDSTFPYQWDSRYARSSSAEAEELIEWVRHSHISRWYAENLTSYDPVFSPIPGGVLPSPWRDSVRFIRTRPVRSAPKNLVFCAHRDKGGQRANPQFDVRRHVTALAEGPWRAFTTIPEDYLSISEFRRELRAHPFTLCVEGGGIDPCPKAFEALLQGSIPIIKESPLADAYRHLPVLVVQDWSQEALSELDLQEALSRTQEEWPDWFSVLNRMKVRYWSELCVSGADTRIAPGRLGSDQEDLEA